jgi:hydroxyacylglutathione hydrolase
VGYEKRNNPALGFEDRAAFVRFMNQDQPLRPANIGNIVAINQGRRPLTMGDPTAPALAPAQFAALAEAGHLVIDARDSAEFGAGHIPGAYNLQLSSSEFEQRVGWVTPVDEPMILVLPEGAEPADALEALAFLGLDQRVKGILAGGMGAWIGAGLPHETIAQISVHQLMQHLGNGHRMRVLDVRETSEWDDGHIEGASYLNYKRLREHLGELDIAPGEALAVLCAGGVRSSTACSILQMSGYTRIHNVTGGMGAWHAAGLPMVDVEGCAVCRVG